MLPGADLSLAAGKLRKNELVTGGFRYDFTESQARLPVSIFSVKNRRFRILEAVTARRFQLISKEFDFSSTKEQKNVKTIIACTESTYLLL